MINIYINTLKSTIDNKNYYSIILHKLYNEILEQYSKYYNSKFVAEIIIFKYIDWIEWDLMLYHKRNELKEHFKNQINIDIKRLLNYLDKVKDGKYRQILK